MSIFDVWDFFLALGFGFCVENYLDIWENKKVLNYNFKQCLTFSKAKRRLWSISEKNFAERGFLYDD